MEPGGACGVLPPASWGLLPGSTVSAQVHEGDVELGFATSLSWSRFNREFPPLSEEVIAFGGNVSCTYFVSPRVDVGGFLALDYSDTEDGFSILDTTLGPIVHVHFRPSRSIVPLVEVSLGCNYLTYDFPHGHGSFGWSVNVGGGADFFVTPDVAVRFTLDYGHRYRDTFDWVFSDGELVLARDVTTNSLRLSAGLTFFLGRNR